MKNNLRYRNTMIILVGVVSLVVVFFLLPFELVITPERRLTFVDQTGKPIMHTEVWQVWHQYSIGMSGDEIVKTDAEGKVYLPKHVIDTRIVSLVSGALREFRSLGIHANYGSSEHVMIKLNHIIIKSYYDGKGLENERVIITR